MGSIPAILIMYIVFLLFTFITGVIWWVKARFQTAAVFGLILSLLGPLLTLFIIAQSDNQTFRFSSMFSGLSAGNAFAIINLLIHLYLLVWAIFMIVLFVQTAIKNNYWIEDWQRFRSKWKRKSRQSD